MCGRYLLKTNPLELQAEFELAEPPVVEARYNLAPTQAAPIITAAEPRHLTTARWGLIPRWTKDLASVAHTINARAETIEEKGVYKEAFAQRRCLVPADGFYEWRHHGKTATPLCITLASHRPFSFAGLWETWRNPAGLEVTSFTIVTTSANPFMSGIHLRMPVLIARDQRHRWLTGTPAEAKALLHPWEGEALEAYEVSPLVNQVGVDDPRCLEPAKTVQLSLL
jgi:putative SOS response-associated peptidase YedK